MSVRVTACDNSRAITGSTMPSLLIHSDRGTYGVAMPPAMPAPIAGETVALFAAAPDMLAALQAMIANPRPATGSEGGNWNERYRRFEAAWDAARAAIAKAEGKL